LQLHNVFWFNGTRSDKIGIQLQDPVAFSSPVPKSQKIEVPGRNGDLYFSENSFGNITASVKCFGLRKERVQDILTDVSKHFYTTGYRRLETAEEPDIYRMAVLSDFPQTEIRMRTLAPFEIMFNCKPQRYYKSGERPLDLEKSGQPLYNPGYEAYPILKVYGSGPGTITAGGHTVSLKAIDGYVTLDCELQEAYKDTANKNNTISAPEFPTLPPGECAVTWTGGVARVELTPRWYTI